MIYNMPNNYKLVNPEIQGQFESDANEKNSSDAANTFYTRMTKTFNNSLPQFHFTVRKGNSDKLYHFKVDERKNKDGLINFVIKQSDILLETEQKFISKIKENNSNLHGGNNSEESHNNKHKKEKKHSQKSSEEKSSSTETSSQSSSESYEKKHSKKHSKKHKKHKKKKHYDSSSDSSFDSLELYTDNINKYVSRQIRLETYPLYWKYYPQLYDISRVFLPSFISDTFPFLEIVYL